MRNDVKVYVNGVLLDSYGCRGRVAMLFAIRLYDPFQLIPKVTGI